MPPWVTRIQVCSNERPNPFPKGDNYEITKIHRQNLIIFCSRTAGPILTKLDTMSSWMTRIQFCSNEMLNPFPRGDNYEIAKIHWRDLKIFFSRTADQFQPNLAQNIFGRREFKFVQMKKHSKLVKVNNFSLNQHYDNHMWFELFSRVINLDHGPLVNILYHRINVFRVGYM